MINYKRPAALLACFSFLTCLTGCDLAEFFNGSQQSASVPDTASVQSMTASAEIPEELIPEVHELVPDSAYKTISENNDILFETALSPDEIASGVQPVLLTEDNTRVSEMYDDGTNGDKKAGDGIYTCRIQPDVQEETQQIYKVQAGDVITNPVTIRYFDQLTDDDFEDVDSVENTFEEITAEFQDQNGNIPENHREDALSAAAALAEQMYQDGRAVEYRVNANYNNVVVKLSSGITYIYEIPIEGTESVGDAQEISVITCQPRNDDLTTTIPDDSANYIVNEFEQINFTSNLDNGSVTRETLKNFSSDQIIIWNGHGGFDSVLHAYVQLGEKAPKKAYTDTDYVEDRIIFGGGYACYTYRFIDAYCGDMTDTLLYLGCCHSGQDGVLASSFLRKNCNVVIGFSESVYASYDRNIMLTFCKSLASQKKFLFFFNNGYHTAGEALLKAKKKHGNNDGSPEKAAPVLFGSSSYTLKKLVEETELETDTQGLTEAMGSVSIDKSYISLNAGESEQVTITSYPDGYTASDFIWEIDDTSIATVNNGTVTAVTTGSTILKITSTDGKYSQFCAVVVK